MTKYACKPNLRKIPCRPLNTQEESLEIISNSPDSDKRAIELMAEGKFDEAAASADSDILRASALLSLSNRHYLDEDFDGALNTIKLAEGYDPNSYTIAWAKAVYIDSRGQTTDAAKAYASFYNMCSNFKNNFDVQDLRLRALDRIYVLQKSSSKLDIYNIGLNKEDAEWVRRIKTPRKRSFKEEYISNARQEWKKFLSSETVNFSYGFDLLEIGVCSEVLSQKEKNKENKSLPAFRFLRSIFSAPLDPSRVDKSLFRAQYQMTVIMAAEIEKRNAKNRHQYINAMQNPISDMTGMLVMHAPDYVWFNNHESLNSSERHSQMQSSLEQVFRDLIDEGPSGQPIVLDIESQNEEKHSPGDVYGNAIILDSGIAEQYRQELERRSHRFPTITRQKRIISLEEAAAEILVKRFRERMIRDNKIYRV